MSCGGCVMCMRDMCVMAETKFWCFECVLVEVV